MARETGLPAYEYPTHEYATHIGSSGYVYARNLLATRLYRCPVVYCEPYSHEQPGGVRTNPGWRVTTALVVWRCRAKEHLPGVR